MKTLTIHLTFQGNCERALNFYCKCFNGKIVNIRKARRSLHSTVSHSGHRPVLYSELIAGDIRLIASDKTICNYSDSICNNAKLNVSFSDKAEFDTVLSHLSSGCTIHLPLQIMPDKSMVIILTDKFSISWILHYKKD